MKEIEELWGRLTPTQRDAVTVLIRGLAEGGRREEPELISVRDASREFGLSRSYLYELMASGKLEYVVPYGRERGRLVRRQDLLQLLS